MSVLSNLLQLATTLVVAAYDWVKTFLLSLLCFLTLQTGYGPNCRLGKVIFVVTCLVECVVANPAQPATALYKVNPTKNIPMLMESNYHEWSWRISSAFIALGMASSCLFLSQSSTEPKDAELESPDITAAREDIAEAEEKLDVASSAAQRKAAAEELQKAREALRQSIQAARNDYENSVDVSNPFHGLDFHIQVLNSLRTRSNPYFSLSSLTVQCPEQLFSVDPKDSSSRTGLSGNGF